MILSNLMAGAVRPGYASRNKWCLRCLLKTGKVKAEEMWVISPSTLKSFVLRLPGQYMFSRCLKPRELISGRLVGLPPSATSRSTCWWGYIDACSELRLQSVFNRLRRFSLLPPEFPTHKELCNRSSVSSWVDSVLPDPALHTDQLYRRTLTSLFGHHEHGVCAWIADVDNCTLGIRRLLSVCMEQFHG